jgi:hypothetical protein
LRKCRRGRLRAAWESREESTHGLTDSREESTHGLTDSREESAHGLTDSREESAHGLTDSSRDVRNEWNLEPERIAEAVVNWFSQRLALCIAGV